jgi:hypothetical protein
VPPLSSPLVARSAGEVDGVAARIGVTMGSKFYTIKFKDRIGLGSGSIPIHFFN